MTPRDPEALQVAFRVPKTLDELGVSYHLGGSYASAVHGIPRPTHDVDLIVDIPPELVQRRVLLRLGDDRPRDVYVKSAEETVLRKLLWFRLGGGASDRLGIRDLLDRVMGEV